MHLRSARKRLCKVDIRPKRNRHKQPRPRLSKRQRELVVESLPSVSYKMRLAYLQYHRIGMQEAQELRIKLREIHDGFRRNRSAIFSPHQIAKSFGVDVYVVYMVLKQYARTGSISFSGDEKRLACVKARSKTKSGNKRTPSLPVQNGATQKVEFKRPAQKRKPILDVSKDRYYLSNEDVPPASYRTPFNPKRKVRYSWLELATMVYEQRHAKGATTGSL